MTVSAITTEDPNELTLDTVDHLAANAYYFRLDTDFYDVFPFPVLATYFFKTSDALIESAFDIYLPIRESRVSRETLSTAAPLGFPTRSWKAMDCFRENRRDTRQCYTLCRGEKRTDYRSRGQLHDVYRS